MLVILRLLLRNTKTYLFQPGWLWFFDACILKKSHSWIIWLTILQWLNFLYLLCSIVHCRVDLQFPKIEVRFQHLTVETFVQVGSRALPTIPNFLFNMTEVSFIQLVLCRNVFNWSYPNSVIVILCHQGFLKAVKDLPAQKKKIVNFGWCQWYN